MFPGEKEEQNKNGKKVDTERGKNQSVGKKKGKKDQANPQRGHSEKERGEGTGVAKLQNKKKTDLSHIQGKKSTVVGGKRWEKTKPWALWKGKNRTERRNIEMSMRKEMPECRRSSRNKKTNQKKGAGKREVRNGGKKHRGKNANKQFGPRLPRSTGGGCETWGWEGDEK